MSLGILSSPVRSDMLSSNSFFSLFSSPLSLFFCVSVGDSFSFYGHVRNTASTLPRFSERFNLSVHWFQTTQIFVSPPLSSYFGKMFFRFFPFFFLLFLADWSLIGPPNQEFSHLRTLLGERWLRGLCFPLPVHSFPNVTAPYQVQPPITTIEDKRAVTQNL